MHRSLTVWEVLYYNAVLRLPPPSDTKMYERLVKQVWLTYSHFLMYVRPSVSGSLQSIAKGEISRPPVEFLL